MSDVSIISHFPVVASVLDRRSGAVTSEDVFAVYRDRLFRAGRSQQVCELALPRDKHVSAIAVVIGYQILERRDGTLEPVVKLWCRQGGSGTLAVEGGGDLMSITGGGPPLRLRIDTRYKLTLFTPAPVFRLELHTPSDGTALAAPAESETSTWTISAPTSPDEPAWVKVVALAVLIDKYDDVIPRRDGTRVSASSALSILGELFCGRSSNGFYQSQLSEALRVVGISVLAGQDKQARVAAHFGPKYPPAKLSQLRERILEIGTLNGDE